MNVKKIMSIFQSFYVDVSIEELTLTLPISFVKRFEYTQMTFHKESFLLIKEKRRGSLSSFVTQARTMGEKANMDVVLVFSKLSDSEKKQLLQARVPFVDFKGNLFFPPLGLVLNANDTEIPKELTPSEQLTWIAFLLTKGQKVVNVDLLSQVTGLPNSTIYRCLRTFKALYWLNKQNKLYTYTVSKKELFLKSVSCLFNPKEKRGCSCLIKRGDVVVLYLPFPTISSDLAVKNHMYICIDNSMTKNKELVKNQTFKPALLTRRLVKNFMIEEPDLARNPFTRPTLIDLDKVFMLDNTVIPTSYLARRRRNVSEELYEEILDHLVQPRLISLNKSEFMQLNPGTY
ncbi:Uncharacterised protein [Streptococcus pneumoniae]|nr:Uncharacterised protein [Streptococcus pneumoniae]